MRAPIKTVHDNYKCNKRIPLHSQFGKYFKDFNCLKTTNVLMFVAFTIHTMYCIKKRKNKSNHRKPFFVLF